MEGAGVAGGDDVGIGAGPVEPGVDRDPVALAGRIVPQDAGCVLVAADHEVHVAVSVQVRPGQFAHQLLNNRY